MSTPAELSARLRDLRDYLRMPQMVVIGPAQEIDLRHALTAEQSADTIDALQAQVEVLREALEPARKAISDQVAYYGAGRDDFCLKVLSQLDAALSPIKASDADRREVKT